MSNESGKRLHYLTYDPLWQRVREYSKGSRLDIGCSKWPIPGAEPYDMEQGNAQTMQPIPDKLLYKLVWSSHCLEHLDDPHVAIRHWWNMVEEEGYLWLLVPDYHLHEHGTWPSKNRKHKWAFSWQPDVYGRHVIRINALINELPNCRTMRVQVCDNEYDYSQWNNTNLDQSAGNAEVSLEVVLWKKELN